MILCYAGGKVTMNRMMRIPKKSRKQLSEKLQVSNLAVKRFRKLRDKVLPFAKARGILTDKDVFRETSCLPGISGVISGKNQGKIKIIHRTCATCGKKIKVLVQPNGQSKGGNYFGKNAWLKRRSSCSKE
jgi:hypothetical protein